MITTGMVIAFFVGIIVGGIVMRIQCANWYGTTGGTNDE